MKNYIFYFTFLFTIISGKCYGQENNDSTKRISIDSAYREMLVAAGKTQLQLKQNKKNINSQRVLVHKLSTQVFSLDSLVKAKDTLLQHQETQIKSKSDSLNLLDSLTIKSADTLKKLDSVRKVEIKTLNDLQATIGKAEDALEVNAEFTLNDSVLWRLDKWEPGPKNKYKGKWSSTPQDSTIHHKIKNAYLKIRQGMVTEIVIETDNGTFRNQYFCTSLTYFNTRFNGKNKLYYVNQKYQRDGDRLFIYLDDAIKYTPKASYTDIAYADYDIKLKNDTLGNKNYLLNESNNINAYFNVAAFTDIKGISGEPNGIIQFVTEAMFITNTYQLKLRHLFNPSRPDDSANNIDRRRKSPAIVPFHFISFQGGLAKFDNDFRGSLALNHDAISGQDSVSRRDLLQRAHYRVGVKGNLLHGFESPFPNHLIKEWQLNIGYNFVGSKVYDTTFKFKDSTGNHYDTTIRTTTQNQLTFDPNITFSRHSNFSLTLSLPFYLVSVKKSNSISNSGWESWARPGIDLMYYLKKDYGSKLFFRYYHYINLKDNTQAFSQIQLGLSVKITDVWNNNSSK